MYEFLSDPIGFILTVGLLAAICCVVESFQEKHRWHYRAAMVGMLAVFVLLAAGYFHPQPARPIRPGVCDQVMSEDVYECLAANSR